VHGFRLRDLVFPGDAADPFGSCPDATRDEPAAALGFFGGSGERTGIPSPQSGSDPLRSTRL